MIAQRIKDEKILKIKNFNEFCPFPLMHIGIDIGSHNYFKRSIINMVCCKVKLETVGWPREIMTLSSKIFPHFSLTQFISFLTKAQSGISDISIVNKLLLEIKLKSLKDIHKNVKDQLKALESDAQKAKKQKVFI